MVTPLRRRKLSGELYTRRASVETEIAELLAMPESEVLERCSRRWEQDGWVSAEALLYLLRAKREHAPDAGYERLFRLLAGRALSLLPNDKSTVGVSVINDLVRSDVLGTLSEYLSSDRVGYEELLDYYEVNFNHALAARRSTAYRDALRHAKHSEELDAIEEDDELSIEVAESIDGYDPLSAEVIDNARYLEELGDAISSLPELERRIIQMDMDGIPIDSQDPTATTMRRVLGKSEGTIRAYRNKAHQSLRHKLTGFRGKK